MDKNDLKYGLLGERLPYSFSPEIHGLLGNDGYGLIELPPSELEAFMTARDFKGHQCDDTL